MQTTTDAKVLHFPVQSTTHCSREDGAVATHWNPNSGNHFCHECALRLQFIAFRAGMPCPVVPL